MRVVLALGGNAILPKGTGTAQDQLKAARSALSKLSSLLNHHEVALTHGNGPQVGSLLLQQHATSVVPEMPLDVLDAMTQGEVGYFIQSGLRRKSAAIITRALVDAKDPAMRKPSKPIGPFYKSRPTNAKPGTTYVLDSGRGYRLVVPSPRPLRILEKEAILELMGRGFTVICGGGGGIPVTKDGRGVEAVIDKDSISSLLAREIDADLLVFVTSVPCAYRDFRTPDQAGIGKIRAGELKKLAAGGHFAPGSMKPKVQAAIDFVTRKNRRAVICSIVNIKEAISGKSGTVISL